MEFVALRIIMSMLLISIRGYSLEFFIRKISIQSNVTPHDNILTPPDVALISAGAGSCCKWQPGRRRTWRFRGAVPASAAEPPRADPQQQDAPRAREATARASLALAIGAPDDMLRPSGGVGDVDDFSAERLFLAPVLQSMGQTPSDLFPPNRIATKCSKCGNVISRFEGYKHIKIGEKKTYCYRCQKRMGLPVREP